MYMIQGHCADTSRTAQHRPRYCPHLDLYARTCVLEKRPWDEWSFYSTPCQHLSNPAVADQIPDSTSPSSTRLTAGRSLRPLVFTLTATTKCQPALANSFESAEMELLPTGPNAEHNHASSLLCMAS